MDEIQKYVRSKVRLEDEVVSTQIGSTEFIAAYEEYKGLTRDHVELHWQQFSKQYTNKDEACFYKILEGLYVTTLNFDWNMTAERFAGIMRIDEGLKQYCKMQAGKRSMFGAMLNYKALARTDIIEAALKLL